MKGATESFGVNDLARADILRADGTLSLGPAGDPASRVAHFGMGGHFTVACFDRKGRRRWVDTLKNGVVNSALDDVLNVYLGAGTATPTWYIGLIDNAGFTAFAGGDTAASHAGWSEFQTYSDATRGLWTPGASSGQSVSNGTSVDFHITTSATLRGLFLVSTNDKGGTDGKLFSTAAFSGGNQAVNNGDVLKVTYTVSAASS